MSIELKKNDLSQIINTAFKGLPIVNILRRQQRITVTRI